MAAETNELSEQLRHALTELPPIQAEVCCLRFLEGYSYDQIAEQTGITVNHVGVLLNRCKALLRKRLQAFSPTPPNRSRREV